MLPPPAPPVEAKTTKKHKAGSASKSSIVIFRDDEQSGAGAAETKEVPVPSTPKFTPYRDSDVSSGVLCVAFRFIYHFVCRVEVPPQAMSFLDQ